MKPLIGIPCRTLVDANKDVRYGTLSTYTRAVEVAGGAPILIPLQLSEETLRAIFAQLGGLLLAGGVDVHPKEFGKEVLPACGEIDTARDATELHLTRWALADDKPVLGICRGIQLLNVAAGGSLYQDIGAQVETNLKHDYHVADAQVLAHPVEIQPDSRVAHALGATRLEVNSLHHQGVKDIAPGLHVVARAPDGIVEAVEGSDGRFVVGVQFHPEWLLDDDARMVKLFEAFVASARMSG
jgi:putative glutamine amidotransferase